MSTKQITFAAEETLAVSDTKTAENTAAFSSNEEPHSGKRRNVKWVWKKAKGKSKIHI